MIKALIPIIKKKVTTNSNSRPGFWSSGKLVDSTQVRRGLALRLMTFSYTLITNTSTLIIWTLKILSIFHEMSEMPTCLTNNIYSQNLIWLGWRSFLDDERSPNLPTREEDDSRNSRRNGSGKCQNRCLGNLKTFDFWPSCHNKMYSVRLWGSHKKTLFVVPLGQIAVFYMNIEYLRWCSLLWTRLAWSHHVGLQQGALSFQIVILDPGRQIWS